MSKIVSPFYTDCLKLVTELWKMLLGNSNLDHCTAWIVSKNKTNITCEPANSHQRKWLFVCERWWGVFEEDQKTCWEVASGYHFGSYILIGRSVFGMHQNLKPWKNNPDLIWTTIENRISKKAVQVWKSVNFILWPFKTLKPTKQSKNSTFGLRAIQSFQTLNHSWYFLSSKMLWCHCWIWQISFTLAAATFQFYWLTFLFARKILIKDDMRNAIHGSFHVNPVFGIFQDRLELIFKTL